MNYMYFQVVVWAIFLAASYFDHKHKGLKYSKNEVLMLSSLSCVPILNGLLAFVGLYALYETAQHHFNKRD